MKLSFKKLALLGLALTAMFVLVGCVENTTTTTTQSTSSQTSATLSDTQKVQAVLDGITLGDVTAVTANLTLPTASVNGVAISWSTEDADIVSATGEITVPDYVTGDQSVTLTLTATLNAVTLTKTFEVTVKSETAQVFLNRVAASIIIDGSDSIVANFKLPGTAQGATIVWSSSNLDVVTIGAVADGEGFYTATVVRPKMEDGGVNTSVTLTAALTIGSTTVEATKSVRIIAEPLATVYTSFQTLHETALLNDYVDLTGTVYAKFKLGYFMVDTVGKYIAIYTTEANASAVAIGDSVHVKGLYKNYNTLFQISNLTKQEVLSSGNPVNITKIVLEDANDLLDVDSSNKLIHGQVYTITVTPQLRGTYNNVYLFAGATQVATVYYNSLAASIDALEEVVGKVVTIDVVYYTFYSGSSVLTPGVPEVYITFDGLAADIELAPLVGQEALDADAANIALTTAVVGGQSFTLPTTGGYGSAIAWSVTTGGAYASIASGKLTFVDVTAVQEVTVTASLTIDGVVDPTTRVFTFTVTPITTSTIAQVWGLAKNDIAQVEGTVYFFINNGYFVFDGTGLLFIYTTAPAGTALGDKLVIFGTVDIYNGQHQIKSAVVKSVTSTGNAYAQTPVTYVPGTTALVSGQTYAVTATIKELTEGGYTNLFLFDGETKLAQIYYRSTINGSYAALQANKDKEVIVNVVFYYVSNEVVFFVYQEGAAGIVFTPEQQAAINADNVTTKTSVVSAEVVALPALEGASTIVWAVKDANPNATILDGNVTYATVASATQVTLVATITFDMGEAADIVDVKEIVVTISTYAEKVLEDKTALTVALTANEFDVITLPVAGLNGSAITWALTATDNATLAANVLTLEYLGVEYSVTVTATLAFAAAPEATETKEFVIVVSPVTIITEFGPYTTQTAGAWTIPNAVGVYIKGVVTGFNGTNGIFVQDASGDALYVYTPAIVSLVAIGDEVVVYGNLVDYKTSYAIEYRFREIDTASLKTKLTTGNAVVVTTLTVAEIEAMNFYENLGKVMEVTGFVVSYDASNIYFNWKLVGDPAVQYTISFYDSLAPWLRSVYPAGSVLPAVQFTLTNISSSFTKVYGGNLVITMTDENAIVADSTKLPTTLELVASYVLPTPTFGTAFAITAISAELTAYITNQGVVTLPEATDAVGTITISVTKGTATPLDVVIPVTIKAMTDAQKLADVLADLPATLALAYHYTIPTQYSAVFSGLVVPTELTGLVALSADASKLEIVRPAGTAPAIGTVTLTVTVGTATQNVDIAMTVMGLTDLFFSEYIEGGSNNKAFEIYNGTGASVDLSAYSVELYANGVSVPGTTVVLTGTLVDGDVYIIFNSGSVAGITSIGDLASTLTYYNGDDALVLKHNGVIIDVIGQVGTDPGTLWGTAGVNSTLNMTLVRKSTVHVGDVVASDPFDPSVEWDAYPQDTFTYLGSHTEAE